MADEVAFPGHRGPDDWGLKQRPKGAGTAPGSDVIEGGKPGRRRPGAALVAAGVAVLLVLSGSAVAAYSALSGGGPHPASVVPANAIAYAELDLDPSAGQKLAAYRLSRRFPATDGKAKGPDDLKGALLRDVAAKSGLDYATQLAPWVGDRVAVAVVSKAGAAQPASAEQFYASTGPTGLLLGLGGFSGFDRLEPLVVLQSTDRAAAERAMTAVREKAGPEFGGAVVTDDWVLLAGTDARAKQLLDAGSAAPLSEDTSFRTAVDRVDGGRVALGWFDAGRLAPLLPAGKVAGTDQTYAELARGVGAAAVRLHDRDVELDAVFTGAASRIGSDATPMVASLPAGTTVAAQVSGFGQLLASNLEPLKALLPLASSESDTQDLPSAADLGALFGRQTAVGVTLPARHGKPAVAVRVRGDAAASQDQLATLDQKFGLGLSEQVVTSRTDDGIVYATEQQAADAVARPAGPSLGEQERFTRAVAEPGAPLALWVDIARLQDNSGSTDPSAMPLDGFGVSLAVKGGTSTLTARLTLR